MSSPEQPVYTGYVYLGVWTNWSRGSFNGLTLTLSHKNGAILTAFLALLITFSGGRFWRIIRLFAHQYLSSEKAKDGIYHQRQVLLRNTDSSSTALVKLFRLSWVWRKHAKLNAFRRNSGLMLLAALNTAIFIAASLTSSKVTNSMGDEVLISSPYCGKLQEYILETESQGVHALLHRQRRNLNLNYANACYGNVTDGVSCAIYRKPRLSYTKTRNISCPFPGGEKICWKGEGAMRLETGYLNSNDDLGLNSKPEDQHQWRTVVECSPLKTKGYTTIENQQILGRKSQRQLVNYLFGKNSVF
jgi:hypothetical protein